MIIDRKLPKIVILDEPISDSLLYKKLSELAIENNLTDEEASFFVFDGEISNQAYDLEDQRINISHKHGNIMDVTHISDQMNLKALTKAVVKYYYCHPKKKIGNS